MSSVSCSLEFGAITEQNAEDPWALPLYIPADPKIPSHVLYSEPYFDILAAAHFYKAWAFLGSVIRSLPGCSVPKNFTANDKVFPFAWLAGVSCSWIPAIFVGTVFLITVGVQATEPGISPWLKLHYQRSNCHGRSVETG